MIVDHIGMAVSSYETSKEFYSKALAPLGIEFVAEVQGWAGFGKNSKAGFWFGANDTPQNPMHIAFLADERAQVVAFYEAAVAAGAKDNVRSGIRAMYHPNYYGAYH